jgi:RNA polymerase sigma factor (sigma-70 family)
MTWGPRADPTGLIPGGGVAAAGDDPRHPDPVDRAARPALGPKPRTGRPWSAAVVGELFRIAFERRKMFDASRASALPWLYGIGSNLLLKHRRGEARRLRASAQMAAGLEAADRRASARALDARVLFSRVADAIEALPDGEREALLLFAWEELSYQGVAEALELPIGTVRSRLNRARARLRELLNTNGKNSVRS